MPLPAGELGLARVALGGLGPGHARRPAAAAFYRLAGFGQREATALLAERFKGQLRFAPGGGMG